MTQIWEIAKPCRGRDALFSFFFFFFRLFLFFFFIFIFFFILFLLGQTVYGTVLGMLCFFACWARVWAMGKTVGASGFWACVIGAGRSRRSFGTPMIFSLFFLNLSMAFSKRTVKSKLLSFHNILLVLSGAGKVSVYIITGRKQKVFPLFSQPYKNRVIVEKSVDNLWTTVENLQNRYAAPYGVAPIPVYRSADRIDNW